MRLRFLGADGNVTGSQHFAQTGDFRFLVDCGMVQERDFLWRNWTKCPEDPASIDAVFLTHAHLDHCGLLPKLVKDGFCGKIYATAATCELAKLILFDSAHIQEEDALYKQKRHKKENRQGAHPVVPLYTSDDVSKVLPLFAPVPYNRETAVTDQVKIVFHEAGHVLGSAFIEVTVIDDGQEKRLLFSGDLGRADRPILRDPAQFTDTTRLVHTVLIESTYGDRQSAPIESVDDQLSDVITRTVKRGGKVIMPVFAVERAQEMLYRLGTLQAAGKIPSGVPIFLDSPMAVEATMIFTRHKECFDEQTLQRFESGAKIQGLELLKTADESRRLNTMAGPALILSSSGMCNAGRIKHHLANHIGDRRNTVLFLGYQSAGTLGRQIVEGSKSVRIHGEMRSVKAEIVSVRGISGHADQSELLAWYNAIANRPKYTFVVHGEKNSAQTFADLLRKNAPGADIKTPEYDSEAFI